jgi:hypothetical protein
MRFLVLICLLGVVGSVFGQENTDVSISLVDERGSTRSPYIQTFPDYFFLWPVIKQRRTSFELRSKEGDRKVLDYLSNKPYSIGVGMYVFDLAIELAFAAPLDEMSKRIYGESNIRDIQLNVLGTRWGGDAHYQKYKGFYIYDSDVKIPAQTPYPQRGDVETQSVGLSVNYTFNNERFSFRSAYNFVDRQLRSAGSFLVFGAFSNYRVGGDSAIVGKDYADDFPSTSSVTQVKVTSFAMAPGYTYSVIYKDFYLNGTLAVGPSHNWLNYTGDLQDERKTSFDVYVAARVGLGYNGERVFGGISFFNQLRSVNFDNMELITSMNSFKILIGYRFLEFGVLKKKVTDLPKQIIR